MFFLSCLLLLSSLRYDGKHSRPCVRQFDLSACSHYFLGWNLFFGGVELSLTLPAPLRSQQRSGWEVKPFAKVLTEWTDAPGNISTAKVRKGVRDADIKEEEEGTRRLRDDAFYWHTAGGARRRILMSGQREQLSPRRTTSWHPPPSKFPAHKLPPSLRLTFNISPSGPYKHPQQETDR